jgi:hypothetical protein
LERFDEPVSHPGVALDHLWEAFGKNVSGTRRLWADPLAHQDLELKISPTKGDIGNGAGVSTMDP